MNIRIWNTHKAGLPFINNNPTAISVGDISLPIFSSLPALSWDRKLRDWYLELEKQRSQKFSQYYDAVIKSKKLLTVEI